MICNSVIRKVGQRLQFESRSFATILKDNGFVKYKEENWNTHDNVRMSFVHSPLYELLTSLLRYSTLRVIDKRSQGT